MKKKYTRTDKITYLVDVLGYDEDYLAEASIYQIDSLLANNITEFEGYMA